MNNTGKVLVAFAAGAAAGAMLGVLFAPAKGSKIRQRIHDEGKKIVTDLEDTIRRSKEKLDHLRDDIERKVNEDKKIVHSRS